MTPTRGRFPRLVALAALLAAAALALLFAARGREAIGRYWLWRAVRAAGPSDAIARAARWLGPQDPRLRALIDVRREDLRIAFEAPSGTARPGEIPVTGALVENVSGRPLVLYGAYLSPYGVHWAGADIDKTAGYPFVPGPAMLGERLLPGERLRVTSPVVSCAVTGLPPTGTAAAIEFQVALMLGNATLLLAPPADFVRARTMVHETREAIAWHDLRIAVAQPRPEEKP